MHQNPKKPDRYWSAPSGAQKPGFQPNKAAMSGGLNLDSSDSIYSEKRRPTSGSVSPPPLLVLDRFCVWHFEGRRQMRETRSHLATNNARKLAETSCYTKCLKNACRRPSGANRPTFHFSCEVVFDSNGNAPARGPGGAHTKWANE